MLDVGFSELVLLFIVGLLVLGPERLPQVARAVGQFVGRARGYVRQMSSELEREVRQSEIREQLEESKRILNQRVDLMSEDDGRSPPPKDS